MIKQLSNKFKSSYWLKSGSYTFTAKIFESGIGLLTFMILVRILSKEQFGVWILFISVSALVESMRKAFVYNPLVKYLNTYGKKEYNQIITGSIVQNLIFSLGSSIIVALISVHLSRLWEVPEFKNVLYIYAISNLFIGFFSHCNYIQQANLSFKGTMFAVFLRKGLFFTVSLYFFIFSKNVSIIDLVVVQIIIIVLIIPINIRLSIPFFNKLRWSHDLYLKLINFGKFTIITNISSMVYKSIDSWMLGSLLTVQAVAMYNPAIRLLSLVEIPIVSLSIISYPQLTRRFKIDKVKGIKELYEKSIGVILAFIIPFTLIIIFFSEQIILLIAGEEYIESSEILKITMLFSLIIPFNRQLGITLNAMGKAKTNMIFVIINLCINVLCNYICIKNFGLIGAAYGTLFAYLLSLLYGQWLGFYLFNTSTLEVLKFVFKFYTSPRSILNQRENDKTEA